jgi:hypothetical protein
VTAPAVGAARTGGLMDWSTLWWVGAAVALWIVARPLSRLLIASSLGKEIGAAALAKQPDTIHLEPASPEAWRDAENARRVASALSALGFETAGTFTIPALPDVTLELMAHPGESMYAAVYEHLQAGAWFELFMRCQDGTSATFTTLEPTGLDDRPEHPLVRYVGADPKALFEKAQERKPRKPLEPARAATAVATFEKGYAESIAWRKGQGISRGEVVKVALKKAA